MNLPPCKDCPNREIGCHSKCEKYIQFKNDLKKDKAKEKAEKKIEYDFWYNEAKKYRS